MSLVSAVSISRAPLAALAAVGVFWGGFSALVPDIKAWVQASDQDFGLALVGSALGGMFGNFIMPRVGRALGHRAIPILALLLVAAFFYPLLPDSFAGLGVAMFFVGVTVALLDITANVRVSTLENRHRRHLMSVNHATFSFAFGLSALAAGMARGAGFGPGVILPALAVATLLLVLLMIEDGGTYRGGAVEGGNEDGVRMPWAAVFLTAAILFSAFIGENTTEAWSALHIERTLGGAPGEGSLGPATLGLVMGLVRLFGHFAASRFGEARLILVSAVLGTFGLVGIGLAPNQFAAIAGVAVVATGMAVVVPAVNSILGRLVREDQRSFALSRAWMFGMLGFFVGPAAMGIISEHLGMRIAFCAVALVVALIVPAVMALGRRDRQARLAPV